MCTKTFETYTNSRFISKVNLHKYINRCQCGFCAECIRQKKSEYALRAFYEAKRCLSEHGKPFVLFDTLTYRDANLHWFSDVYSLLKDEKFDFMRFSRDDIKKFFKRLRVNLERSGYVVKDKLRYLLTSEYGSVLKTNRPHYHVLFFVNFEIEPCLFSRFISEAWIHGITDGVKPRNNIEPWYAYKSKGYVLENRVFRDVNMDLNRIVNYVVKYITKDMFVYKKLYKRVYAAFCQIRPNWQQYYVQRLSFRRFKNQVLPFHLQSKGFGEFAIKDIGIDNIMCFNSIPLPFQNKGIKAFIPLNSYYKRKMFYQTQFFNGKLRWVLNDRGKEYKKMSIQKSIENFAIRLNAWNKEIDSEKLAAYHFLRRGVLVPEFMKEYNDSELIDELLFNPSMSNLYKDDLLYYNYTTPVYSYLGGKFVSDKYHSEYISNDFSSWCVSPEGFLLKNPDLKLLNVPEYDELLSSFESFLSSVGEQKDKIMTARDKQHFRYKELGMLN